MRNLLFCLMGPTASGKTALACELIEQLPFEIISVDSAMIYRGMNIGTAKPDAALLERAPHHLIDILDPTEAYSAALFCKDVEILSERILNAGRIPLLVGGTMMYFHALQQGLSLLPTADEETRMRLSEEALRYGWAHMHQRLERVDAPTAARIHPNDTQRIQRALEVYALTNRPLSDWLSTSKEASTYQFVNLVLVPEDRSWLHQRIALRFQQMLHEGLIDEVEALLREWPLTGDHPSLRSVGYRQVYSYLNGEYDEATLHARGIAATRQLAKRQLTWLRHWPNAFVFQAENEANEAKLMAIIKQILDNPTVLIAGEGHV